MDIDLEMELGGARWKTTLALPTPRQERIYAYIREHPGTSKRALLKGLGSHSKSAESLLACLEREELLVYEDAYGLLYVFEKEPR